MQNRSFLHLPYSCGCHGRHRRRSDPAAVRWELVADSQAAFTLTNAARNRPAERMGDLLQRASLAQPGSVGAGFDFRTCSRPPPLVPRAGFAGLRPARRSESVRHRPAPQPQLRSVRSLYRLRRREDSHPVGRLRSRPLRSSYRDAGTSSRFDSNDSVISTKDSPIFSDAGAGNKGQGELRLTAMAQVIRSADLGERGDVRRPNTCGPYFPAGRTGGVPLRLEVGASRPSVARAYELVVDPTAGVRMRGRLARWRISVSSRCAACCHRPLLAQVSSCRRSGWWDAASFGYRGFMLDSPQFHQKSRRSHARSPGALQAQRLPHASHG